MSAVVWAMMNILELLVYHVIRLSGDSSSAIADEFDHEVQVAKDAITNWEGK